VKRAARAGDGTGQSPGAAEAGAGGESGQSRAAGGVGLGGARR